jgi:hydroxymethylpyrimidine pyrophosphatase-like HAD family hydrolase
MPEGCTKGAGVEHLATRLNIDKNNVMVVGDEQNDISMLKKFKNSITLASSKPDVREAATYVIDAKPSTVVKKAIQKIVFNDE